jgi:hypothetical protein
MASGIAPPAAQPGGPSPARLGAGEAFIEDRLQRTRRQVKLVDLATAAMTLALGVMLYLFAAVVLDQWIIPGGLGMLGRCVFLAGLLGGGGYYFVRHVLPPLVYRINPIFAADTIEHSWPTLKNSLINFLLVRNHRQETNAVVYHALEQRAAADLSAVKIETAVDRAHVIRLASVLTGMVLIFGAYLILSPKSPLVSTGRILWPWADLAAPTRVTIGDVRPGNTIAFFGDAVPVTAEIAGLREGEHATLVYSTTDGRTVDQEVPLAPVGQGHRMQATLPPGNLGLQQSLTYRLQAGDCHTPLYRIEARVAPAIVVESVDYHYPPYTGFHDRPVKGQGDLRAIEGTRVTIHASANHAIRQAEIDLNCAGLHSVRMDSDGQKATGQFTLQMSDDDRGRPRYDSYRLLFTNSDGQTNRRPVRYRIEVQPDLPPDVKILVPREEEAQVGEDGQLQITIHAEDPDFGLRRVALRMEHDKQPLAIAPLLQRAASDRPHQGPWEDTFVFHPKQWHLKAGDNVTYWAEAEDNREPTANHVETGKRVIHIVAGDQNGPDGQPHRADRNARPQGDNQPQAGDNNGERQQSKDQTQPRKNDAEQHKGNQDKSQSKQDQAQSGDKQDSGDDGQGDQSNKSGGSSGSKGKGGKDSKNSGQKGQPGDDSGQDGDQSDKSDQGNQSGHGGKKSNSAGRSGEKSGASGASGGQQAESAENGEEPNEKIDPTTDPGGAIKKLLDSKRKEDAENRQKGKSPEEQVARNDGNPGDNKSDGGKPGEKPDSAPGNDANQGTKSGNDKSAGEKPGDAKANPDNSGNQKPSAGQPGSEKQNASENSGAQKPDGQKGGDDNRGGESPAGQKPDGQKGGGEKNGGDASAGQKPDNQKGGGEKNGGENSAGQEKGNEKSGGQQAGGEKSGGDKSAAEQKSGGEQNQSGGGNEQGANKPKNENGANSGGGQENGGQPKQGNKEKSSDGQQATGNQQKPGGKQPDAQQTGGNTGEQQKGGTRDSNSGGPTPEAQGDNQPRQQDPGKGGDGPRPGGDNPEKSPSISPHDSTAKGDSAGDKSGHGKSGGGQGSQDAGKGTAGSHTPDDNGSSVSNEQGNGQTGDKPGQQVADVQHQGSTEHQAQSGTGQEKSTDKPADGQKKPDNQAQHAPSASPPKQNPSQGGGPNNQASQQQGAPGQGNPTAGNAPGKAAAGPPEAAVASKGEDANLEYARKQTNLALEYLRDQMGKEKPKALKDLGWSREEAQHFLDQWTRWQREADGHDARAQAARKSLDEAIRSLGLRSQGTELRGGHTVHDRMQQLHDAGRSDPPSDWDEMFRAYSSGVAGRER